MIPLKWEYDNNPNQAPSVIEFHMFSPLDTHNSHKSQHLMTG